MDPPPSMSSSPRSHAHPPSRCEGFLVKKGAVRKNWKKRFFILEDGEVKYFAVAADGTLKLKGKFTVRGAALLRSASAKPPHRAVLRVLTPKRCWSLQVDAAGGQRDDELQRWSEAFLAHGACWRVPPSSITLPVSAAVTTSMSGPQLNPGRGTQHELQLELPTRVAGAGRWPVFALKVSLRGLCGGKIYLNGKLVSNQAVASRAQEVVSIVPVNQWLFCGRTGPANVLTLVLKYPTGGEGEVEEARLKCRMVVRECEEERFHHMGPAVRLQARGGATGPAGLRVLEGHGSRIPGRNRLAAALALRVLEAPFPLWCWSRAEPLSAHLLQDRLREQLLQELSRIHALLLARDLAQLELVFLRLLDDMAYSSLAVAEVERRGGGGRGGDADCLREARRLLLHEIFESWLTRPDYRLAELPKEPERYRLVLGPGSRFVALLLRPTLSSHPKNQRPQQQHQQHQHQHQPQQQQPQHQEVPPGTEASQEKEKANEEAGKEENALREEEAEQQVWPIRFVPVAEGSDLPDEPANFAFSRIDGHLVPTLFWEGPFP